MPVYTVTTPMGTLDETQKEQLAVGITDIHGEETGAPEPLIHVVFNAYPPGVAWTSRKPGAPIVVNASIRFGRSEDVRRRMLERINTLVSETIGVPDRNILVALFDFQPHWAMEAGMVLPSVDPDDETRWDAAFYAKYPERATAGAQA